jgi:cell division protein FtsW
MGLLLATLAFGVEVRGAQRWLVLPIAELRFQPVEVVKLSTLLLVVSVASRREGHSELSRRRATVVFGLSLAPVTLLLLQPDLGNSVLLLTLVALILLVAGTPLRALVVPTLAVSIGVAIYVANNVYAWRRVECFWDPWKQADGCGFQLVQSFVAFGKGGLIGVGLGNGHQKLAFLPEAHTDFILALVAEELGLLGVLAVLGAFAVLFVAGSEIARKTSDRFSLLLAFAMTALLTLPALVNAAVVMGVVPTKGLTLPFMSHGGTSLVTSCTVLGLLLGVSRRSRRRRPTAVVTGGGVGRPA